MGTFEDTAQSEDGTTEDATTAHDWPLGFVYSDRITFVLFSLGCMAERLRTRLFDDGYVDVIAGPDAYRDLPRLLAHNHLTGQTACMLITYFLKLILLPLFSKCYVVVGRNIFRYITGSC
jgi:hypothetical protein